MPSYRLAKSLERLRAQINAQNPNRDKSSDGWIGDTSHQKRGSKSDHNPNAHGVVTAIDVDENLTGPMSNANELVKALQASRDPRIKYIIYEGRITVPGDVTRWKAYHGPSPHDHHFHISVASDPKLYDDASDWHISAVDASPALPASKPQDATSKEQGVEAAGTSGSSAAQPPILKEGSRGAFVVKLQRLLKIAKADGVFGPKTKAAVKNFQVARKLPADGIVGPKTWKALEV
jgi:murein L,D-transpeptidase YcbB/YkuD